MSACKYGDPCCPCQDGDLCHYEGDNPMSPESAALQHARTRVMFIERPRMYCAACGSRAEERQATPTHREVWCNNGECVQHGKRLNVFDATLDGVPHT